MTDKKEKISDMEIKIDFKDGTYYKDVKKVIEAIEELGYKFKLKWGATFENDRQKRK